MPRIRWSLPRALLLTSVLRTPSRRLRSPLPGPVILTGCGPAQEEDGSCGLIDDSSPGWREEPLALLSSSCGGGAGWAAESSRGVKRARRALGQCLGLAWRVRTGLERVVGAERGGGLYVWMHPMVL